MSSRISSFALAAGVLLAGCSAGADALPGEAVECALGAGAELTPACTLEREAVGAGIVLHHPGGGFRRFRLDPETLEVAAADGAERVGRQKIDEATLFFAIGGDAYRIPLDMLTNEP